MTSGRDEYLERTKKHIDYEKENELRVWWLNNTGGSAHDGLTVRDYFAAQALQLSSYSVESVEAKAMRAYRLADAMMEVRQQRLVTTDNDIKDLELTVRAENVLKAENIRTIAELTHWTRKDLLRLPNCGATTVGEIVLQLSRMGLTLRGE